MIAQRLQAQGPVRHVVWIAAENTIESPADEAWIGEQERGVLQVFRLIKAFLQLKYGGQPLEWTLVTVQSQPIHSCDPLKTAHAGVHGLAGSMAKEYPGWQIRAVDLEAGREFPVEDMFRLPAEPQGNSWVYRTGEWHKQKLVPIQEAASEPTLFQEGGVYVVIGGAGGIGQAWSEYMIRTYQANVIWIEGGRRIPAFKPASTGLRLWVRRLDILRQMRPTCSLFSALILRSSSAIPALTALCMRRLCCGISYLRTWTKNVSRRPLPPR